MLRRPRPAITPVSALSGSTPRIRLEQSPSSFKEPVIPKRNEVAPAEQHDADEQNIPRRRRDVKAAEKTEERIDTAVIRRRISPVSGHETMTHTKRKKKHRR